jgi:hypothetical protein
MRREGSAAELERRRRQAVALLEQALAWSVDRTRQRPELLRSFYHAAELKLRASTLAMQSSTMRNPHAL